MVSQNKKYALAMLSATSLLCAMGNAENTYANESTGVVTTSSLNVRSGPSTDYSRIGSVKKGEKVNIISSQNGWYKIKYANKDGFVSAEYISTSSDNSSNGGSESLDTSLAGKIFIATDNLNVRSGGSTSYNVITSIRKGESVQILGTCSTGWYKIKLSNGQVGYASNKYLKESSTSNDTNTGGTQINKTMYTTANLNIRSGPSTSYGSLGVLKKGSSLTAIESYSSGWYKVKLFNNTIGYCSGSYLSYDSVSGENNNNNGSSDTNKPEESSKEMTVKAYAYFEGNITATGTVPTAGRTIAVDPKVIPYGSKVYIPQLDKVFIAEDCGGAIKGNKIDIFMNSREECINWGVKTITVKIID